MFATTQMPAIDMAFPDVCKTPAPPLPFIPIPYPNMGMHMMAIPTAPTFLVTAMPVHNLLTTVPISLGDFGGVMGGLVSQIFIGPDRPIVASLKTFATGMPMQRMLTVTAQNGMAPNMVGTTISPSQVTTLVMG